MLGSHRTHLSCGPFRAPISADVSKRFAADGLWLEEQLRPVFDQKWPYPAGSLAGPNLGNESEQTRWILWRTGEELPLSPGHSPREILVRFSLYQRM